MKITLLRLSRSAACLVLAGALLAGCSLLPAASPLHEGTASSQAPQYYSPAWAEDNSLHFIYAYSGNGGGTVLRGGTVLYEGSSSDSIQLVRDTLTGEANYYLVARSTPGTEDRTTTLYDADGNTVMTFERAVTASISGGLLILNDAGEMWAFSGNDVTGGIQVFDLATGEELPVPEQATGCIVVDSDGQKLIFNCYALPEGLSYSYDDPDEPLHQYVLVTDRQGNTLMREDGCSAGSLYIGGSADALSNWVQLSWMTSDWSVDHEALYNTATGESLQGEVPSTVTNCGGGMLSLSPRDGDGSCTLYDFNNDEAVELGRFDAPVYHYTPGCVMLAGGEGTIKEASYTLIDLASGEHSIVQRTDYEYQSGELAALTADNTLKVYDGTTGALLVDVDVTPVEGAPNVSVTALPGGYALLQYDDENYDTIAIQSYGTEGLLWDSSSDDSQYTYLSYLTLNDNGPLLTGHYFLDGISFYDLLDVTGTPLLRRLGSCYRPDDDLPDGCFIARQGFDYGLMDSTGQWLYRQSIFSSTSDENNGGYLY